MSHQHPAGRRTFFFRSQMPWAARDLSINIPNGMSQLCLTAILLCCGLHIACFSSLNDVKDSNLMRWYDKHGILCSRLRVRTPESGLRGVFAEKDIPGLDGIAVIPSHMIIRSPFKDMEEIVQVNATNADESVYQIVVTKFYACRSVGSNSTNQPNRGCLPLYAKFIRYLIANARLL